LAGWQEKRLQALGPGSDERDRLLVDAELATDYLVIEDVASAEPLVDSIRAQSPGLAAIILEQGCRMPGQETRSFSIGKWIDWEDKESSPGSALRWILIVKEPIGFDSATQERIEARLQQYEMQYASQPTVLKALGDLWLKRGAIGRAIEVYRQALVGAPDDVGLLNNLACLIAEKTGHAEESLPMIDRAMEIGGRQPYLIDSKGYILTIAGRHADAIPFFEEAAKRGTDPRAWLHWYMALKETGRGNEATAILRRVDVEAMRRLHLTEAEQRELDAIPVQTVSQ
jgi:tetratricopeptide (TPR) repeat protein